MLIIAALFILESEIGIIGIIKSLCFIIIGIASGGAIYYCIEKINESKCSGPTESQVTAPTEFVKQKWGGVGIPSGDPESSRLGTEFDPDVQAFHKGMGVYADLKNDSSGDSRIAARSQFQSQKNENAVINRSKFTVNSVKKYFEDELQANEQKNWVDNEELEAYI